MTSAAPVSQLGAFVPSDGGYRFRLVSQPADRRPRGTVILVHAFAEEMNKSRRMSARLARLLASNGWRVVQKDLCGCGDSSGDFGDASWATWIDDIRTELIETDASDPIWLCCTRAGALLVSSVLENHPRVNLVLWQPVVSGAQHLQQFLRLHAGARIVGSGKVSDVSSPAQRLRAGLSVEVGGYLLGPALAAGMEQAAFDVPTDFSGRIAWFELSADEAPEQSPLGSRTVQRLRERGIVVDVECLQGPSFWQTQEIEESGRLLDRSVAMLAADAGHRRP